MLKKNIVVFGVGGFGREIMEELYQKNKITKEYNILGFVDDNLQVQESTINGYNVLGTSQYLLSQTEEIHVLICVGENEIRKIVVEKLKSNSNIKFPNFIARDVTFNPLLVEMGKGNLIYTNAMLSVNLKLGDFNYINSSASISHDVKIGDYTTVSPSAMIAGDVTICDHAYIGAGSVIREGKSIGRNTIIGMGSIVISDVEANVVAYGNPCKVQRQRAVRERVFR